MASTLSLGSAGYDLLDPIGQLQSIGRSGSAFQLKSKVAGTTIDQLGVADTGVGSSNVNVFGSVSNFQAALGDKADTLSIFGDVNGGFIYLDDKNSSGSFNDILNVQGNLRSSGQSDNQIYGGGGNDTIRIAGSAEDASIFLGLGNDSLVISGSSVNVDIKGDDDGSFNGNDYIEFRGTATDTSVNSGGGNDTVIFSKGLSSTVSELNSDPFNTLNAVSGLAAVELGSGNDSLVLGNGTYENATFNTGSGKDTISLGSAYLSNVRIELDGAWDTSPNGGFEQNLAGGDKLTSGLNSSFFETQFSSNNSLGDTLVFGSGNSFYDTGFNLGQGNDSLVFGSGSAFIESTINTGEGADTIVFGANSSYSNLTLDLGNDSKIDFVRFAADPTSDIRITGASDGDVLIVGAQYYNYSTSSDSWVDTIGSAYAKLA